MIVYIRDISIIVTSKNFVDIDAPYKLSREAENNKVGRPKKEFEHCQPETKRKRVEESSKNICFEESCEQLKKKFKSNDNGEAAKILDIIVEPEVAKSLYQAYCSKPCVEVMVEQALGLIVQGSFHRSTYQLLRNNAKEMGHDLYPPYYKVGDVIYNVEYRCRCTYFVDLQQYNQTQCFMKMIKICGSN